MRVNCNVCVVRGLIVTVAGDEQARWVVELEPDVNPEKLKTINLAQRVVKDIDEAMTGIPKPAAAPARDGGPLPLIAPARNVRQKVMRDVPAESL